MSGAEQSAIRAVLDEYKSVANVRFVLDNAAADPDINFGKVGLSAGVGGSAAGISASATTATTTSHRG